MRNTVGYSTSGDVYRGFRLAAVVALVVLLQGCLSPLPDRAARIERGYIFYLDGAGGGGALHNYARGVRQGFLDAGYAGSGEMFDWNTGFGLTADQMASVEYKRQKAGELAQRICAFRRAHPHTPVSLIGFSAGTVVAVFALEVLPADVQVDTVVMLSGSLSADYDLTRALEHVHGVMFVFTSHHDDMLQYMMRLTGTADRRPFSEGSIGVEGCQLPPDSTPRTRHQYAKIVTVPWTEEFSRLGDTGGHFYAVGARFIQNIVAPLLLGGNTRMTAPVTGGGLVSNPDYERWAGAAPGSWLVLRGTQALGDVRTPLTIRTVLIARDRHRLVLVREFGDLLAGTPPQLRRAVVPAHIDPREHPAMAAEHTRTELPPVTLEIAGRRLECAGSRLRATGDFPGWGVDPEATIYTNPQIPSGVAKIDLKMSLSGETVEFDGETIEFQKVPVASQRDEAGGR